jgi:hypothetical protein
MVIDAGRGGNWVSSISQVPTAFIILEGVQATISPAGMVTGARGGTLTSGSNARPDWKDEPSESMMLENPGIKRPQFHQTLRRNNGPIMEAWRRFARPLLPFCPPAYHFLSAGPGLITLELPCLE